MGGCGVPGCSSRSEVHLEDGIRFFSVPSVRSNVPPYSQRRLERRRALWLSKLGRMDLMLEKTTVKICGRHFISGKPAASNDETNPDWVPSVFMGPNDAREELHDPVVLADPESDRRVGIQFSGAHDDEIQMIEDINHSRADRTPSDSDVLAHSECISCLDAELQSEDCELMSTIDVHCDREVLNSLECDAQVSVHSDHVSTSYENSFGLDKDIMNSTLLHDGVAEEFHKLQEVYIETVKSRSMLRDKLTEAEVDKLELSQAMDVSDKKCDSLSEKCKALEAESVDFKTKLSQQEARIKELENEAKITEKKVCNLEEQLASATKCIITLDHLQNDDSLVNYYTGLPSYGVFNAVLTLVTSHVTDSTRCLEPWQCLLLTLMRLRLGLQLGDLAYRFGICKSSACNIFEKWLHYLYVYLEPCVNWPDRETLYKTMPNSFKEEFGKSVAVIIDCFELFCERPGALDSRAMTWSNYKHHNTVKFLIGITPLGAISFISQGWGGRVSDRHVTAQSGLYEKLLPNDVILADRGFTISEDVGFYCAKVLIPAFTRGQAQLSAHDITDTRRLAALRVHIERVIGLVKNRYRILKTTLHRDFLEVKLGHKVAQIDEVVRVCCALTNLSPGIV